MDNYSILDNKAIRDTIDYSKIAEQRNVFYKFCKRFFDIVLSIIGLIFLFVVMLVVSIMIALEDGFPIFFIQERSGENGKVFKMYKFRSMCKNAPELHKELLNSNELDGPAFKMKDDPRVTRVGKFIRRTSIDELPQLVNIIKGEMSIVGPRPLPTYENAELTEYQKQRLLVKPGLTCYWQCSGRNNVKFDEWMEMDLKYIREASLWVDFKIILMTVKAVFKSEGAY
jgi:lipopolysaccharide/colanic/teichoic acid biosynthesis glycosyltransferase